MDESSFRYNFKNEDVLKFELLLRKEIAASARALDKAVLGLPSSANPSAIQSTGTGKTMAAFL